jgi:hypothetical protein
VVIRGFIDIYPEFRTATATNPIVRLLFPSRAYHWNVTAILGV